MKRDPRLVRLSWDHHHGLAMAHRILTRLPELDDAGMAALYSDLLAFWATGLLPHFRVENECLLARLVRHRPSNDPAVVRTQRDHLAIERLVLDLRDAGTSATRRAVMMDLGLALQVHIRWEEAVLFGEAQATLTSSELEALAADVEAALDATG